MAPNTPRPGRLGPGAAGSGRYVEQRLYARPQQKLQRQLPIGLVIEDCPVLVSRNGAWAALPAKPVLDREGWQLKPDGKPQYAALLKWRDRELQDRWSAALIELLRQQHPEALSERAAA